MRIWKPFLPSEAEGDEGVVGRDARGDGVFAEVGDGVLIGAVVVHHPDLFSPGPMRLE
jgi:hypothetical protein